MRSNSNTETESVPLPLTDTRLPQEGSGLHRRHYSRPLKVRQLPMRYGWYWLIEGFMLWVRSPAFLSFLTLCCIISILLASIPPYIGELLGLVLYPGLMLGVFNGCRAIDRKRTLSPGLLLSGFRRHALLDLLLAGFISFIVLTTVLLATWLIDGGIMWRLARYAEIPDTVILSSPPFTYSFIAVAISSMVWYVLYLFVPQLIGWWRLSVPNALAYSLKGCLLNFLPLLIYAICFGFFVIALPFFVINFFGLLFEGLGIVVCVVFLLVIIPTVFASFYVAARDIFGFPRRRKHKRRPPSSTVNEREKQRISR